MGEVKPAAFYDEVFATDPNYRCRADESTFAPLWKEIASRVLGDEHFIVEVLDLGCGPAHIVEYLTRHGVYYHGVDFSPEAIRLAHQRFVKFKDHAYFSAEVGDVAEHAHKGAQRDVYLAIEFLEHVADDLAILRGLPPGRVIASLPSKDSAGHVRWFTSAKDVAERYAAVLDGVTVEPFMDWWIMEGRVGEAR